MAYSALSQLYMVTSNMLEGIERARQVRFELYTDNMQAILGYVEMRLGHWDQARALFEQGNQLDGSRQPHDDHCILEMGALLLRQGQLDEARRLLESQLPD